MLSRPGTAHPRPGPLRVALLSSRRAPGLSHLLEGDPARGRLYELVAAVVSDSRSEVPAQLAKAAVPCAVHDLRDFCAMRGARLADPAVRRVYDAQTVRLLNRFRPQLVLLSGYLHLVTGPLLAAYPDRLVNLHDADLALPGRDGLPRYRGLRSTYDALAAGEPETRSTAHLVTADLDAGPLLVRSAAFPAHLPLLGEVRNWQRPDILKASAYAQREWMMRAAWGRLLSRVIALFAQDGVRVLGGRAVVDGRLGPEELPPETAAPRRAAGY